ncbi:MerR family transcriptional regulator [Lacticaseibacillus saniviri]|uniref:HTH merR-type domain-containing protein n=1 Tax=Lacticaseibacillus saniviri JCM 17471 = DSM 24301 TaxID=1293598 RepID=A0A0R2N2E4_9LACO|nr:MerR family transcriptional regulator [Lacticaseibacillus saniviri]KRO18560.1 hypothetical protein IV56_GL000837 [Lacticaseibacillus saniviri JCM 17471 = DSM 24301]MCG4281247.1 MerR family transcriptional regulator [Lacticaseibacillus saniviri]
MTEIRDLRKRAVLPIGTVIQLTELSARQIRYYEAQGLIQPERTPGNHRLYALRDVEDLLSIKEQLDSGLTLAEVKRFRDKQQQQNSDAEVRQMLRAELMNQSRFNQPPRVKQGF